jgi:hypothetical protein
MLQEIEGAILMVRIEGAILMVSGFARSVLDACLYKSTRLSAAAAVVVVVVAAVVVVIVAAVSSSPSSLPPERCWHGFVRSGVRCPRRRRATGRMWRRMTLSGEWPGWLYESIFCPYSCFSCFSHGSYQKDLAEYKAKTGAATPI